MPFIVLAGLFTVRAFIISHDCGHGSFTSDKKLNDLIGFWTGFIGVHAQSAVAACARHPPRPLRRRTSLRHGQHLVSATRQYEAGSFLQRLSYRLYRNPLVILGFGGPWLFLIEYRWFDRGADSRMKRQVLAVNALWLSFAALVWLTVGPMALVLVQLPIALIGTAVGVWLFYFQHHYPDAYFGNEEEWDFTRAALEGSSFLRLPRWLQFFSGNIGYHHIHHLSPKIPNYRLEACHEAIPFFKDVPALTLRDCAKAINLTLVGSETNRWTTFRRAARAARPSRAPRLEISEAPPRASAPPRRAMEAPISQNAS